MWAVLAVIVFLAVQVFLLRNLMKVDSFFARQEEPEETEVLSLAFSDPDTAEKLTCLLEGFTRENPEVDVVLHTDPSVAEAVYEGRAAIGFLTESADGFQGLNSRPVSLAGLTAQQIVWKTGPHAPCTDVFLRYVAQYCGNSEGIVL